MREVEKRLVPMAWTLQVVKDKPLIDVVTRCQEKNANFHRLDSYFHDHPFLGNISVDWYRARGAAQESCKQEFERKNQLFA